MVLHLNVLLVLRSVESIDLVHVVGKQVMALLRKDPLDSISIDLVRIELQHQLKHHFSIELVGIDHFVDVDSWNLICVPPQEDETHEDSNSVHCFSSVDSEYIDQSRFEVGKKEELVSVEDGNSCSK